MKRLFFACLLAATPLLAQNNNFAVPYTQFVLPNGLNVILHEDHSTPTISVNIWYHVGSGSEKPGRNGFAHLFEHIMFEGSANVPEGKFDEWLEAAGGNNNGSTNNDRTNYYESIPGNALDLALFLESDRMGYLLGAMSPAKVDGQRDVVKNERRQRIENQPYGRAFIELDKQLHPENHPYSWPTIGYMDDLTAASYEDVVEFFNNYYSPNNASLVIAGAFDAAAARAAVEKWFGEIPRGPQMSPVEASPAYLSKEKRVEMEDKVQLPRLYMAWLSAPIFTPGDAELDVLSNVLSSGKNSRLYKRLVYELQIAQDVFSFQYSRKLASMFGIVATARAGHTLSELEQVIQEEIDRIKRDGVSEREVQRAKNQLEASFYRRLESVEGKSDQLNSYYFYASNPDYFNEDLSRYLALDASDIRAVTIATLRDDARVILSIVPEGKRELAATAKKESD